MTRSLRTSRITQPIAIVRHPVKLRDPVITSRSFTCFRLVPAGNDLVAIELHYTRARMAVFCSLT